MDGVRSDSRRIYERLHMHSRSEAVVHESLNADVQRSTPLSGVSGKLAVIPKLTGYFRRYLEEGYYPYVFEGKANYYEKVRSVVEKTLYTASFLFAI